VARNDVTDWQRVAYVIQQKGYPALAEQIERIMAG
jgi:hypothetical protein